MWGLGVARRLRLRVLQGSDDPPFLCADEKRILVRPDGEGTALAFIAPGPSFLGPEGAEKDSPRRPPGTCPMALRISP